MATLLETFDREYTATLVDKNPEYKSIFATAGVFTTSSEVSQLLRTKQKEIVIPSLLEPDYNLESNYSNTIYNDVAEPRNISFSEYKARIAFLNEGWVESALERELTGISPNELIARRINKYWERQTEMRAIASIFGVYNKLAKDASVVTTATRVFDVDAFIDATATLSGDESKGLIVVNSKVKAKMRKDQMLVPFTDPSNLTSVDTYNGYTVAVDDKLTTLAAGKFLTMILDKGAVIADSVANVRDLRTESSEARGNGGGMDVLWTRRNVLVHPQGFSFTSAVITGGTKNQALSPSLTDLTDATNWEVAGKATDAKVRFLITNAA